MAYYKLTIKNKTGTPQNYSFFSNPPAVSGGASGPLFSNILKAANNTPNGANASLQVWLNYYAICGSYDGSPEKGAQVSINKSVPIKLGSKLSGNISMGSSVSLTVTEKTSCDLSAPENPGRGKIGNFEITTASDQFTATEAKNNHLLIGIATSEDGDVTTAMATFNPYPSSKYQIQPAAVYYVATGERFTAGASVKVEQFGSSISVDFNARGSNDVTLIHNEQMEFEFVV